MTYWADNRPICANVTAKRRLFPTMNKPITIAPEQVREQYDYMQKVRSFWGGRELYVYIETFGCQQNEADSERLCGMAVEMGYTPTLSALRMKLMEQPEQQAQDIALALELFTTGSLDIFGHGSNVDLDKRVTVFDIQGLGPQLKPAGLLVITDTMLNRVTLNWKRGKRTHVFIDEFHVVFESEFSATFFSSAWRQFRKRNAYPTAITQNVEYLLDSAEARSLISNSELVVMLNQAAPDREKLGTLLNISPEQMSYITNADAGCGLIKYGSSLVPFINRFPKNTKLYELMTTTPGEGVFAKGQAQ